MKKPLWTFFTMLRDKTPLLLSIDQYDYFLRAFQLMPMGHFLHDHDLRDFCKIFWLKDYDYELDFDQLYESFVDRGNLLKHFGDEKHVEEPTEQRIVPPEQDSSNISEPAPHTAPIEQRPNDAKPIDTDPIQANRLDAPRDSQILDNQEQDFVDFELVIREVAGEEQAVEQDDVEFTYTFTLNDQAIMPFHLRHFAQRLRRMIETPVRKVSDELNMDQMIRQYSEQRYIEDIIYQYKDSSESNVILLADRFGSMLAYEYLENQLAAAIQAIPDCNFEHFYFYNLPKETDEGQYLLDHVKADALQLDTSKHSWNENSHFFILSDAGAHAGMVNRGRLRASLNLWNYLKSITEHVHWFNPVPQVYLKGTTAHRLGLLVPMIYPVQHELNKFFKGKNG